LANFDDVASFIRFFNATLRRRSRCAVFQRDLATVVPFASTLPRDNLAPLIELCFFLCLLSSAKRRSPSRRSIVAGGKPDRRPFLF